LERPVDFDPHAFSSLSGHRLELKSCNAGLYLCWSTQSLSEDQRKRIAGRSTLRRPLETGDVARMVEYLLGEGSRNVTGSVWNIDAGNTA